MLLSLTVKDFVIVDNISLDFHAGFTVLTGETGAGKSILLDALSLLLGDRAEGAQVREGAERAEITAEFDTRGRPEIDAWLEENGLNGDDDVLLLRRLLDKSGRSRSFVNGQAATLSQLKQLGEFLVDIHGQHAHQSLMKADAQRQLLDAYAGSVALARDVNKAWQDWQAARRARSDAERLSRESEVERERLNWQINELSELNLQPDEWSALNQSHSRLANAAELAQSAQLAVETLSEMDNSCLTMLSQVQTRLSKLANLDPRLADTLSLLDSVDAELREVVYSLRDYASDIDENPGQLAEVEGRLDALMSTARKYRVQPQDLQEKLDDWQQQLQALEASADIEALSLAETSALARYRAQAEALSGKRRQAASELSARIGAEMQHLAMSGARFAIELAALPEPGAHGLESIEYLVAANAGTSLRPLAKVASGGELSRISLAMQVVISQVASVPTLIFDEVDVGIGGRVAEVIGHMLRQLGQRYQVLCITHLPQVASCGSHHWQVSKSEHKGRVKSRIEPLDSEQRVLEIARMLGGVELTQTTREHAAEMLASNAAAL
ncbi:DNA repair protein RecN (Recombination protein N) [Chromobacterium alkanivorans]|uniref:DNA repair protein RecN n=1 Tax=Chromobacterium TaxID=535 RepID=UPI0006529435|nr:MULTISPECIES: DNA repair protein RecN [Chromobacterium]KMN81184.1 DNA repair protein [Chromobacterium sp. LK11]MCS3805835.1 DNA repair protein RecN (Recombination protein N) [Chromobacterium alkanivorans]MCS3820173.1 DNA repair protein RecN (Recombination protein N) [Chromobacterium alkanivorans]MCS3874931.1 DNA repair protein RecN (Recombination protein N) [Chromobacterium alkanivorans]